MASAEHKFSIISTEIGRLDSAPASVGTEANTNCNPDMADGEYFGSIQIVCDTDKSGINFFDSNTLNGCGVHDSQGKYLGEIVEMLLDLQIGAAGYVKLSLNGDCAAPGEIFAIPRNLPAFDVDNKRIFLSTEKNHVEDAVGVHWDSWPNMVDHSWMDDIRNHYGV